MLTIGKYDVVGWDYAIACAHVQAGSLLKASDSKWLGDYNYFDGTPVWTIGPKDLKLMKGLIKKSSRKFMRYIDVYLNIEAPLYWWNEFDTCQSGVVRGGPYLDPIDIETSSYSDLHKIHAKPFELEDFSCEHLDTEFRIIRSDNDLFPILTTRQYLLYTITVLNNWRDHYLETKDKHAWYQMIQLLPNSYNQRRTVKLNYDVIANIYKYCDNCDLDEWRTFCDWIETLPYSELITRKEPNKKPGFKEIMEAYDKQVSEMIANEKE